MKISYNWLKNYLNTNLSPERVSELLTSGGLEVEDIIPYETIKGGLEGIVIGQVMECQKHPNADKLSLTKVNIGTESLLSIVCGAPNVSLGQKVVVATVGTTLYSGNDSFIIKQSKIRGELSEGMICAEDEIGIGTSHAGIIVLPEDAVVGTLAKEYYKIEKDYVFEIGLTPNRSDATSHIGVARDLMTLIRRNEKSENPVLEIPSTEAFKTDNQDLPIKIVIEDTDACPRYAGLTIKNIKVKESPVWLKNYLSAIGLRPINNIVDITNFVLMETGQPLHAFDYNKIEGKKIVVKKLEQNYPFTTLDGIERKLGKDDLMICNEKTPMCIGGVYGGNNSGVEENTQNIFLESAYFDSATIRKTSKLHNLKTDAAFRFERGTDPNAVIYALKRAALLIKELAVGEISSEIIDVYSNQIENKKIEINIQRINKFIGQDISKEIIIEILQNLGITIIENKEFDLLIEIPTFKVDVTREADVIEEILRVYGYDNILLDTKLLSSLNYYKKPGNHQTQQLVSEFLTANGFIETMNNSLTKGDYYKKSNAFDELDSVKILNPLSSELDVMRQTLLFESLVSIKKNFNYKSFDLKFYEFGKHYQLKKQDISTVEDTFQESNHLAILMTGNNQPTSWMNKAKSVNFYDIKNLVDGLLQKVNLQLNDFDLVETEKQYFEYGIAYLKNSSVIAEIGKLNKETTKLFDLQQDVFYADVNWDNLFKLIRKSSIRYKEISNFPEVRRDLALLIDKKVSFQQIKNIAFKIEKNILKRVELFDIYEGEQIDKNKKSYAISFILQEESKTLNDKTIDKTMQKLLDSFKENFDASLR